MRNHRLHLLFLPALILLFAPSAAAAAPAAIPIDLDVVAGIDVALSWVVAGVAMVLLVKTAPWRVRANDAQS